MSADAKPTRYGWSERRAALGAWREGDADRDEFAWLAALARIFEDVDGSAPSVERAVDRVIEAVMERTNLNGRWYLGLDEPLAWLAESLGRPAPSIRDALESIEGVVCVSEVEPDAIQRRCAVRRLSAALTGAAPRVDDDLAARASKLLRPSRPRLDEALDAVRSRDAQGALEVIVARGLLDESWLDDAGRARGGINRKGGVTLNPKGNTARALLALLASDAKGVARAEALALEVARRLAPFNLQPRPWKPFWVTDARGEAPVTPRYHTAQPPFSNVIVAGSCSSRLDGQMLVTSLVSAGRLSASRGPALLDATRRLFERHADVLCALTARRDLTVADRHTAATLWSAAEVWTTLCELDALTPSREGFIEGWTPAPPRVPLKSLPSPLEPLFDLWDTGYALHAFDLERGLVVLFAPPLDEG